MFNNVAQEQARDTSMEMKSGKLIQSVDRAIQILKCFEDNEELGVTEISKIINLHKSTTFGLICTLEANKLLEKNEDTGRYRLGIELFRIGTKVNSSLRRIAFPYLEKLVKMFQETVNLVILDDIYVIYLEKVESTHSMRISTVVGGKLPLYCTAVGKAILANLTEEELNDKINKMEFMKFTDKTICDKDMLLKSLKDIKKNGYAEELEELEVGLTCIGAPIYNHLGTAFAAISVSGPTSRMNDNLRKEIRGTLMKFAQEMSKSMGYYSE